MEKRVKGYVIKTDFGYVVEPRSLYGGVECSVNIQDASLYPSMDIAKLIRNEVAERWLRPLIQIIPVKITYITEE